MSLRYPSPGRAKADAPADARGRLLATSQTLATAAQSRSSTDAVDAAWTLAAGSGITLEEITTADDALLMPWERPDGATIGLLVQAEVDGTLAGELVIPWGGSGSYWPMGPGFGTQGLRFSAAQWLTIVSGQFPVPQNVTPSGAWRVALTGGGYSLPADSVVKVYLARIG